MRPIRVVAVRGLWQVDSSKSETHPLQPTVNPPDDSTSYDEVPYPPYSFPATHIARLAAIGRMFSLPTADPGKARILELGCGSGVNLLAMAQLYPEAEFVGIDTSASHIELAEEARSFTGLVNAHFIRGNVAHLEKDLGTFDYIIAHGLYSWVPAEVREAILRLCREHLRVSGVVYISYNCLPGWRLRGALRDMMSMHTRRTGNIRGKIDGSKALLKFLAASCDEDTAYGRYLKQELDGLRGTDDAYLAHEFLETNNDAFYFSEFVQAAAAHHLAYLGEADPSTMAVGDLPDRAAQALVSLDLDFLGTEQYMDFARNRVFRSTLLCHASAALDRNIDRASLNGLEVMALVTLQKSFSDKEPAVFIGSNGKEIIVTDRNEAGILERLAAAGRHSFPCDEVIEEAMRGRAVAPSESSAFRTQIERFLLQSYFRGVVDLTVGPLGISTEGEKEKPCALPLARWQASKGYRVSSHRLDMLQPDTFVEKLIILCDGTRDREALIEALAEAVDKGELHLHEHGWPVHDQNRVRSLLEKIYDGSLEKLRRIGLLAGE